MTDNQHHLLWCLLDHGGRPVLHEGALLGLVNGLIVAMILHREAPVGHCAVRAVVRIVGADAPDLLAVGVVQIELGAAGHGSFATRHTAEGGHRVLDAVGRVVVVVIPADTDVALGQLIEAIALGADLHLLGDGDIADILETRGGEQIADLVVAVVEDDPLHEGCGVGLGFEHRDGRRDELAAIVGGGEDTDGGAGHWDGRLLLECGADCFNWGGMITYDASGGGGDLPVVCECQHRDQLRLLRLCGFHCCYCDEGGGHWILLRRAQSAR